ncbi:hypothetical protein GE21DRAFT_1271020 [Neurospora crassa]|nr:hypothetical protein GE21DRAFT_1271020 [Neurospora crassa]
MHEVREKEAYGWKMATMVFWFRKEILPCHMMVENGFIVEAKSKYWGKYPVSLGFHVGDDAGGDVDETAGNNEAVVNARKGLPQRMGAWPGATTRGPEMGNRRMG